MMGLDLEAGWLWLIGGILLLIMEILAPGFFLLFIGAAAIATGAFTLLFDFGVPAQLALFALYATLAVMVGKRWYAQPAGPDELHGLNNPGQRMIGRTVEVVTPVDDHGGRVRVGDSEWSARGGPAEPGERVKVTGVEGNCLLVEHGARLPPP